jgi:hypothetical protein
VALLFWTLCALGGSIESYAEKITPLIDPTKLTTLGVRGANPRVQKAVYWLAEAKLDKTDPAKVAEAAVQHAG